MTRRAVRTNYWGYGIVLVEMGRVVAVVPLCNLLT